MESGIIGKSRFYIEKYGTIKEKTALKLVHEFSTGKGLNKSIDSILVRPFHKVVDTGSPPKNTHFLFLRENNLEYLAGCFSNTEKRILFFPGMRKHFLDKETNIEIKNKKHDTILDHLSLELDLKTWHYSFLDKQKTGTKAEKQRMIKLDEGFYFWFVWRFKDIEKLESLPARHEFDLVGQPEKEVLRRGQAIIKSVKQSTPYLLLHDREHENEYFWNLQFFVSNTKDHVFPLLPSYEMSDNPSKILQDGEIVEHHNLNQILINDFEGSIWISVDKIKGKLLTDHSVIIPGKEFERKFFKHIRK